MNDYCITPPFIQAASKPNLLLMLDNSASMYHLSYASAGTTYCYDNTYNNTARYTGYFVEGEIYQYVYGTDETAHFLAGQTLPTSGGTYRTSYLYLQMSGTKDTTDRRITSFIATGKFLNWLTASKLDNQKAILTGGKYNSSTGLLEAESRGCVGRRFVKEVPAADLAIGYHSSRNSFLWHQRPMGHRPGYCSQFADQGRGHQD